MAKTTEITPVTLLRTEPTGRGLQLQPSVLEAWRAQNGPEAQRLAAQRGGWAAPRRGSRAYGGAMGGRTMADWVALSTSADAEIYTSLRALRNRARQLCRDNEYARQAKRLVMNNVVGQGVRFQSEVRMRRADRLDERTNDAIELAWARWCRSTRCDTSGKLSFGAMQRMAAGALLESGEILLRKVKRSFGDSRVPFALEVIESDQLVDNWTGRAPNGNEVRMGVEVDEWRRPVAYWLYPRHPGDNMATGIPQSNEYQRVPADEVIHLALWERPGQTRGVPMLHAALAKLRHVGGTEEAEIVRARASAAVMGFITTPEADMPGDDSAGAADDVADGERVWDMSPGVIRELGPGEQFSGFNPSTANAALDPFLRHMLRSIAAAIGLSYESLSRDYGQATFSSSRLALLDDRDNWRVLQSWLIETMLQPIYEAWLEMAVLSGELNLPGFEAYPEIYQSVRWMPRGWDWVDPAKEVAAYKAAVRAGFMTAADVIAGKGGDYEDVFRQLKRERDLAGELELVLESDAAQTRENGTAPAGAQSPAQGDGAPGAGGEGAAEGDDGEGKGASAEDEDDAAGAAGGEAKE